jgi:phytoene/squalene synthetase
MPLSAGERDQLDRGAQALGAAFQKVNFLRDLSADFKRLGRSYFPNVTVTSFDEATKNRLVADIDEDIALAASSLPLLPSGARPAVTAALLLFAELNRKIARTPAAELIDTRISVSNPKKLLLVLRANLGAKP